MIYWLAPCPSCDVIYGPKMRYEFQAANVLIAFNPLNNCPPSLFLSVLKFPLVKINCQDITFFVFIWEAKLSVWSNFLKFYGVHGAKPGHRKHKQKSPCWSRNYKLAYCGPIVMSWFCISKHENILSTVWKARLTTSQQRRVGTI